MHIAKRWIVVSGWMLVCGVGSIAYGGGSGDCDGDGDIDMHDLQNLQLCFSGPFGGLGFGCECSDLDSEGDVDLRDFARFADRFTGVDATLHTELAGHALAEYPYFEFVLAFHEDESIDLAVDPTRFPSVTGQTVDIYVTVNRSAQGWMNNPALTDVRGGAVVATFSGENVQENTIELVAPFELDGDGGTDIGVGYDVVVDVDQDGMLGAGDLIAGRGDEAGLYVVDDLVAQGPLAVTQGNYSGGSFLGQRVYYPSDIASMGELPLVTLGHGNGHNFQWYDYLGEHLASHGYVFMSYHNNTVPGIESASTTTLTNTDYFLGNLGTIQGGVLNGHIDTDAIVWIGHSRGGEGVVRAFTRLRDGLYSAANFTSDNIVLVSSIAPNNSLGAGNTEPGEVPYHLLWGAADGDISGQPFSGVHSFAIFERASGFRQSTYVHGADHNDFNCCGFNDFTGPGGTQIGRVEAQRVAKADYLALIEYYLEDSPAALDYLVRQYETFKPMGVADTTVVVNDFKRSEGSPDFVLDNFQTGSGLDASSSGGSVFFDVTNVFEGRMDDGNTTYSWTPSDPMNGMTRSTSTLDDTFGVVFDWAVGEERFIEWDVPPGGQNFADDTVLSFRACQGTRHPRTTAEIGDLSFMVSLRDGRGVMSSINFGTYGGGIEEPYARTGSGTGFGWQNEFEVIRIRLADFLANGSGLDLSDIEAVRFDFGGAGGSSQGRLGLDDVMIVNDRSPSGVDISIESNIPAFLSAGEETSLTVRVDVEDGEVLQPGSEKLHYRFDSGSYLTAVMTSLGDDLYEAVIPEGMCGQTVEFFFGVVGSVSGEVFFPPGGVSEPLSASYAVVALADDFQTDMGWVTESLGATAGLWERGVPVNDPGWDFDPESDADGSGQCYLTGNTAGNSDVDGGGVRLTSPGVGPSGGAIGIRYDYYLNLTEIGGDDSLLVEINGDVSGGGSWVVIAEHTVSGGLDWRSHVITPDDLDAAGVTIADNVKIRFTASDVTSSSIVEAGVDAFQVFLICSQ